MNTLLRNLDTEIVSLQRDGIPQTIAARTRRVYDMVSAIYPLSTHFFHSRAHKIVLDLSGIENGMRVLEIATGSGEMFRRLVRANPGGETVGVDLSPRMAAKTFQQVRRDFPAARAHCQAVDARYLPFRDHSFDAVVCCYLVELLAKEDIFRMLREVRRVLQPGGKFSLVLIGQNADVFNHLYKVASSVAPAFWGQQVEARVPDWMRSCGFKLQAERKVRQLGYPSRVVVAHRS
ncbi:MAG: class I SAM-dependent methyltransferase [Bryobacteraceae bacterium]